MHEYRHLMLSVSAYLGLSMVSAPSLAEDSASVLVLDASGSMWAQLPEGRSKIEVAREVIREYLQDRDANAPLGVIAYGHNRKGDCGDIEIIAPLGSQNPTSLADQIDGINPKGKTPLTDALEMAVQQIPRTAESADVILITDGLETCDRDPCALAKSIAAEGIDIRAHVVGFGLSDADVNSLSCIPDATGGQLLSPQSGQELADAFRRIEAQVVKPEPQTPELLPIKIGLSLAEGTAWPSDLQYRLQRLDTDAQQVVTLPPIDNTGDARAWQAVDISAGKWRITAEASVGGGERVVEISQTVEILVPFAAAVPDYQLLNLGTFQPLRAEDLESHMLLVKQNAPKQSNKTIYIYVLPEGAKAHDEAVYWNYLMEDQPGTYKTYVEGLTTPGRYRVVITDDYYDSTLPIYAEGWLTIQSVAPVQVKMAQQNTLNSSIPLSIDGDLYPNNTIQVYQEGNLLINSFISDLIGDGGLALPPIEQAGQYELHYLYNDEHGERDLVKIPFMVGQVTAANASTSSVSPQPASTPSPNDNAIQQASVDSSSGAVSETTLELLMGDITPGGEIAILWTGSALPGDQLILAPAGNPQAPVWEVNAAAANNPVELTLPSVDFQWDFYYLTNNDVAASLPLR